jgi:hypothetical protein
VWIVNCLRGTFVAKNAAPKARQHHTHHGYLPWFINHRKAELGASLGRAGPGEDCAKAGTLRSHARAEKLQEPGSKIIPSPLDPHSRHRHPRSKVQEPGSRGENASPLARRSTSLGSEEVYLTRRCGQPGAFPIPRLPSSQPQSSSLPGYKPAHPKNLQLPLPIVCPSVRLRFSALLNPHSLALRTKRRSH